MDKINFITLRNNDFFKKTKQKSIICIGFFDGLHKGHISVINKCLEISLKEQFLSIFFTFNKKFIDFKNNTYSQIFSNDLKFNLINNNFNFNYYFEYIFNANNNWDWKKFINFLINKLNCKAIVVGKGFKFGKNRIGDLKKVRVFFPNLDCYEVDNVNNISSSTIKLLLKQKKIQQANKLLLTNYQIEGKVKHGLKIARNLGFKTANIILKNPLLIPLGSYITKVIINNKTYKSVTCYTNKYKVETYILDFNQNIYNKQIKVYFLKYLFKFKKINNEEKLILHIKKCINECLIFFKK